MIALGLELRGWADAWLGHRLVGGVHQRLVRDVFLCIIEAADDPEALFVWQDASKYFDSL